MNANEIRAKELEKDIDALHAELQTRKPVEADVAKVMGLLAEFLPLATCLTLQEGEKQFGKKYIQ